ncbi:MAG: transporter substrate-binding domain-containing protein [Pseudomonadota bacterium]
MPLTNHAMHSSRQLLLLAALCLSAAAPAADVATLRTGMESGAELKWNADGKRGLCPEILRAIMRHTPSLKIVWSNRPMPQKRLVAEVESGHLDLACALGRTPERDAHFTIPDVALYNNTLVAALRNGDALRLTRLEDLKQLASHELILVNGGARLVERLREKGIVQVDEGGKHPEDNLRKLALGRGRVFLYHEPGMAWEIERAGLTGKLRIAPAVLSVDPHYLLLSPRVPPALAARISAALNQLKSDGSLRAIALHWSPRIDISASGQPTPRQ